MAGQVEKNQLFLQCKMLNLWWFYSSEFHPSSGLSPIYYLRGLGPRSTVDALTVPKEASVDFLYKHLIGNSVSSLRWLFLMHCCFLLQDSVDLLHTTTLLNLILLSERSCWLGRKRVGLGLRCDEYRILEFACYAGSCLSMLIVYFVSLSCTVYRFLGGV